jgi:hypothetical protein
MQLFVTESVAAKTKKVDFFLFFMTVLVMQLLQRFNQNGIRGVVHH